MGEVVCDQCALSFQRRGRNEQIRVGKQCTLPVKVAIQCGGAFHHLIGEREDQTGLTQESKCGFLGSGLFGLESARSSS